MSNVSWTKSGLRDVLYTTIRLVRGVCNMREQALTVGQLALIEEFIRKSGCQLPPGDKTKAIGMQHRWCVTTQTIKDLRQLQLIVTNRLAAVRAGYFTIDFAIAAFEENGFNPKDMRGLFTST